MNIELRDTRFIYRTNFSGDPARDETYHSAERKFNIVIPTQQQADELVDLGVNVKMTSPKPGEEEGFIPTYHVVGRVRMESKWPPKIYLVNDRGTLLLDKDSVGILDTINVANVNATFNVYTGSGKSTLYVDVMYVEQGMDRDPFRDLYNRGE